MWSKDAATERLVVRVTKAQKAAIVKAAAEHPREPRWKPRTITAYILDLHYRSELLKAQGTLPEGG